MVESAVGLSDLPLEAREEEARVDPNATPVGMDRLHVTTSVAFEAAGRKEVAVT